jgi:hypothetical protein
MAHDCNGIWFSWLKQPVGTPVGDLPIPNDGGFQLDKEDNAGRFNGIHLITRAPVSGQCVMNPHQITFHRTEGITVYTYHGHITEELPVVLVARGKRRPLFFDALEFKVQSDDEWTGVKTT